MKVHGIRQWVSCEMLKIENDDFVDIGAAYEEAHGLKPSYVGQAETRVLRQSPLVEFAADWISRQRR